MDGKISAVYAVGNTVMEHVVINIVVYALALSRDTGEMQTVWDYCSSRLHLNFTGMANGVERLAQCIFAKEL